MYAASHSPKERTRDCVRIRESAAVKSSFGARNNGDARIPVPITGGDRACRKVRADAARLAEALRATLDPLQDAAESDAEAGMTADESRWISAWKTATAALAAYEKAEPGQ